MLLTKPLATPVLIIVLVVAAGASAAVAWHLLSPVAAPSVGLLATVPVCIRELVASARMPAPPDSEVRRPPTITLPEPVRERTVANVPTRALARVYPDADLVGHLRSLRESLRSSTSAERSAAAAYLTAAGSVDPVHLAHVRRSRRRRLLRLLIVLAVAVALSSALCTWASTTAGLVAAVLGGVVAARVAVRPDVVVPASRVEQVPDAGYSPFAEFGCVGGNLAQATTFGGAEAIGIAGEKRTAELLETWLDGISRVAILHSLRFPGSARADIDHVVMIGHRLFIIDSKAWKGGTYQQLSAETIRTPDGACRESAMPAAAAALGKRGWGDVEVLTVIHATSGEISTIHSRHLGHMILSPVDLVRLLLDARVQEQWFAWSSDDAEAFEDRLASLRRMLVSEAPARRSSCVSRAA